MIRDLGPPSDPFVVLRWRHATTLQRLATKAQRLRERLPNRDVLADPRSDRRATRECVQPMPLVHAEWLLRHRAASIARAGVAGGISPRRAAGENHARINALARPQARCRRASSRAIGWGTFFPFAKPITWFEHRVRGAPRPRAVRESAASRVTSRFEARGVWTSPPLLGATRRRPHSIRCAAKRTVGAVTVESQY